MILENRSVLAAAAILALAMSAPGRSQQPIVPVDFRPFMDIENSWKARESRMDLTMSSLTPFVSGLTCQWMTR